MPTVHTKRSVDAPLAALVSGRADDELREAAADALHDATRLLSVDHREVKVLARAYGKLIESQGDAFDKQAIALLICAIWTAHTTVEDEVFYPAIRSQLGRGHALTTTVDTERSAVRRLIEDIESGELDPGLLDTSVMLLADYIDRHAHREESQLFPLVRASGLDIDALGRQLAARRNELFGECADVH